MPAFAQQPAPEPQTAPAGTAERASDVIVVTANKRQEFQQDIAVAVTAVTSRCAADGRHHGLDLDERHARPRPTRRVTSASALRGSAAQLTFGADPGVANYNDGLYTLFAAMAGKDRR